MRDDLDRAGGELRVFRAGQAGGHLPRDLDHILPAQSVRGLGDLRMLLRAKDDLGEPFAVAQIDENDARRGRGGN